MSFFRAITDFSAENEIRMLLMAAGSVATPTAGYVNYFIDTADGKAKIKNSSGVVSDASSVAGLDFKASVRLATATDVILPNTPTYLAGVLTAGVNSTLTVDGSVCALNDRVLVKNQASSLHNGIYYLSQLGSGAAQWKLTRALDFDLWSEIPGSVVSVEEGAVNAGTQWLCNVVASGTIGGTAITFVVPKNFVDLTTSQTITGQKTFVAPVLGAATVTSLNAATGTLTIGAQTINLATGLTYFAVGGSINLSGGNGSGSTGGSIQTNGSNYTSATGGSIQTNGGSSNSNAGGVIQTYGGTSTSYSGVVGGAIQTYGGSNSGTSGGAIQTFGGTNSGSAGGAIRTYGSGASSPGGAISTFGGSGTSSPGGAISTYGGSGSGASGGSISTFGGSGGASGGSIQTNAGSGSSAPGGAIQTFGGSYSNASGGSIQTNGGSANYNVGGVIQTYGGTNSSHTFVVGGDIKTYGGSNSGTSGGAIQTFGGTGSSASGGAISTYGGTGSSASGGSIKTYGGSQTNTAGGSIETYGGASTTASGGAIQTYGGSYAGGAINTSNGGGSINTTGYGSIALGNSNVYTCTNLVGSASSSNKTATLPNFTGTVAVTTHSSTATHAMFSAGAAGYTTRAIAVGDLPTSVTKQAVSVIGTNLVYYSTGARATAGNIASTQPAAQCDVTGGAGPSNHRLIFTVAASYWAGKSVRIRMIFTNSTTGNLQTPRLACSIRNTALNGVATVQYNAGSSDVNAWNLDYSVTGPTTGNALMVTESATFTISAAATAISVQVGFEVVSAGTAYIAEAQLIEQ